MSPASNARLAIIDSGGANIASLRYAVERLGVPAELTTDADVIRNATHVILPGVGSAADCMNRLQRAGLIEAIKQVTQPFLGICVGMQLLFESSEEGDVKCFGLLPGRVQRFPDREGLPVPHMGWNTLQILKSSPLLHNFTEDDYVYYVHSYAAPVSESTLAVTEYGNAFSAVVQRDNIFGAQFHPERSAKAGAKLIQNFLALK
ncbi:MAG TPA: imidazole glycerol phosphate synthase subunit HisH [Steroidobacteraceae bacterium]|nr:imidazole glycerol phosphate synthase subunit HisH [Steroidobacteraceae bacterium]